MHALKTIFITNSYADASAKIRSTNLQQKVCVSKMQMEGTADKLHINICHDSRKEMHVPAFRMLLLQQNIIQA